MSFKVSNNPPLAILRGKNIHAFKKQESRALDQSSMYWANHLLGNDKESPVLEISIGNLQLQALHRMVIAVVGGDMPVFLNGEKIALAHTHRIDVGDVLSFKYFKKRLRTYIAVQGGFFVNSEIEEAMGKHNFCEESSIKQATYNLHYGDVLHTYMQPDAKAQRQISASFIDKSYLPQFKSPLELRVVLSPRLSVEARQRMLKLMQSRYAISMLSSSCQYYLKSVDQRVGDKGMERDSGKLLEDEKSLEKGAMQSDRLKNKDFLSVAFPEIAKKKQRIVDERKIANSKSLVMKFSNFVPLYFNEEEKTTIKVLVEETNPIVAKNFVEADGYILPIDASKLVQLPAGEQISLELIGESQALLFNQQFERFFSNHDQDEKRLTDSMVSILDRPAHGVEGRLKFPLLEVAAKANEKVNA